MRALITGITGFAGSHLAEHLLAEHPEVEVFGSYRWRSRMENIDHLLDRLRLVETDLRDATSARHLVAEDVRGEIGGLSSARDVPAEDLRDDVVAENQPGRLGPLFVVERVLSGGDFPPSRHAIGDYFHQHHVTLGGAAEAGLEKVNQRQADLPQMNSLYSDSHGPNR